MLVVTLSLSLRRSWPPFPRVSNWNLFLSPLRNWIGYPWDLRPSVLSTTQRASLWMWFLESESPGPAVVLGSLHGESDPQASLPQALIHLETGDVSLERRGEVGAAFLEVAPPTEVDDPGQAGRQDRHWIYLCRCHLCNPSEVGLPLAANPFSCLTPLLMFQK